MFKSETVINSRLYLTSYLTNVRSPKIVLLTHTHTTKE